MGNMKEIWGLLLPTGSPEPSATTEAGRVPWCGGDPVLFFLPLQKGPQHPKPWTGNVRPWAI